MPSFLGKLDRNTFVLIGFLNLGLVGVVETFSESETLPSGGNLEWAKSVGSSDYDSAEDISSFADGSSIVAAYVYGTAIFGEGEANETVVTPAGQSDVVIARYNTDGSLEWAKIAGGYGYDYAYGITTLADGSSLTVGDYSTEITFGLGEENETTLSYPGDYNFFIAEYRADGTLAWAKTATGSGGSYDYSISSVSDQSVIVSGYLDGTITFGQGEENETVLTSAGNTDIFLAKYAH